jgi:hypothetical protein
MSRIHNAVQNHLKNINLLTDYKILFKRPIVLKRMYGTGIIAMSFSNSDQLKKAQERYHKKESEK